MAKQPADDQTPSPKPKPTAKPNGDVTPPPKASAKPAGEPAAAGKPAPRPAAAPNGARPAAAPAGAKPAAAPAGAKPAAAPSGAKPAVAPAAAKPGAVKPAAARPAAAPAGDNVTAKPRTAAPRPAGEITAKPKLAPAPAPEADDAAEEQPAAAPEAPAKGKGKDKSKPKAAPAKAAGVWGIDLGQCGLKAVRLAEENGQLIATAFDFVEHPKILSQPDADPDQLTREALEKFLSRNTIKGDIVAISVPGQSGLARFVKLPPVEEKKIGDIVKFEAKQQIPFPLEEVVWDYQKIGSGVVTDGFAMDTEIGLFAMKRDMVARYLQHFKEVNVDVHVVQMAPLALCNYVAFDLLHKGAGDPPDEGKPGAVVALDIGTDSSNLIITDGGRIIWQRPIPLGGNHFTRALTKDLKLTFAKAEHLKRNAMKSPELKKILASIKPVLNDFVSEVQRSLGYFTNTHRDVQIEYMVGLGNAFRLPGLQRFLAEKLQLDVRKPEKLERATGPGVADSPVFNENLLTFPVAYGLALQGMAKARLLTNLLPPEIRTERMIKAKKPWAVAAAAILLLSTGALAFGYGRQVDAYSGKPIQDAREHKKRVDGEVNRWNREYNAARAAAETEASSVNSIVKGVEEQANWLHLMQFIDRSVPTPETALNPEGFSKSTREYLDELEKGAKGGPKDAYKSDYEPWKQGKPKSGKRHEDELADGLDRVINFEIVAVNSRFSNRLSDFWMKLPGKVKSPELANVLPKEDLSRPPGDTDKGWVIEMRGYTYHHDKGVFVQRVLLENLAHQAADKLLGWPVPRKTPEGQQQNDPPPGVQPGQAGAPAQPQRAISHIILLDTASNLQADRTTPYEIIKDSKLKELVVATAGLPAAPGAAFGAPPPQPSPFGADGGRPGVRAGDWASLAPDAVSPAGAAPVQPGARGVPGQDGGRKEEKGPPPRYTRTEFIILFIWREPWPSAEKTFTAPPTAPAATDPNAQPPS